MVKIIFCYQTIKTTIEWSKYESFEEAVKKFKSIKSKDKDLKINEALSNCIFLYNGKTIENHKLTFNEIANPLDKESKQITVLVLPIREDISINFEDKSNLNMNTIFCKKRKRESTKIPTIEELSSIIFD